MNGKYLVATVIYAVLVVYASLFPLNGWRLPGQDILAWFTLKLPHRFSRSDFLVNIIAYVPFGFLVLRLFWGKRGKGGAFMLAAVSGIGLSFAMELIQTCLPSRNASMLDLLTNSFGALCGAVAALFWQASASPEGKLGRWRDRHLLPGPQAEIGMLVVLCWALSQLAPFVPSLDLGGIKNALKPLWYTAHDLSLFKIPDAVTYCCYIAALGVAALASVRQRSLPLPLFVLCAAAVLFGKIFVLGRQISLEALCGLLAATVLLAAMSLLSRELRCYGGMFLVLAGFAAYQLKAGAGGVTAGSFNWVPFQGQLVHELNGFGSILEGTWPFAALSLFSLLLFGASRRSTFIGGILTLLFVFILERLQLAIPGRVADITQALLALAGWLFPYLYLRQARKSAKADA